MEGSGLNHGQIERFLHHYPDFARRFGRDDDVRLVGQFERVFTADGLPEIEDSFRLVVVVPDKFPAIPPLVFDAGDRIPKDYHRLEDGAFCLGSRLRLAVALRANPDLVVFFDSFVVPYLYRYAHIDKFGKEPWPDLPHGAPGLLLDDARILGAKSPEMCVGLLDLLALRKRVANKRPCPCGEGVRFGRCRHRVKVGALRRVGPRWWFRAEARELRSSLKASQRPRSPEPTLTRQVTPKRLC